MSTSIQHRAQVVLDTWRYHQLKAVARRRGVSLSALLREKVDEILAAEAPKEKHGLESIMGIVSVGGSGEDHDEVIYGMSKREAKARAKARARALARKR